MLANPTLELRDSNGALLLSNNDWQDNPAQAAIITAAGLAPSNNLESAIAATLPPGLYTALLAGLNNTTGIGLVEVYDLGSGAHRDPNAKTPPGGTPISDPRGTTRTATRSASPGDTDADPAGGEHQARPGPTQVRAQPRAQRDATRRSPTATPAAAVRGSVRVTAPALPAGWVATNDRTVRRSDVGDLDERPR